MYERSPLFGPGRLPEQPTEALPGTEQKIRVMIERASRREQLFHPLDGAKRNNHRPPPVVEALPWPEPIAEPPIPVAAQEDPFAIDYQDEPVADAPALSFLLMGQEAEPAHLPG
jgi:hypothetical protein